MFIKDGDVLPPCVNHKDYYLIMEKLLSDILPNWQLFKVNSTVLVFVLAIVPGFIILFVRSQFVVGRILPYPAGFLGYLTVSTVYWALLFFMCIPIVEGMLGVLVMCGLWWAVPIPNSVKGLTYVVFLPILVGVLVGRVSKYNLVYETLNKFRLNPVHPTPSAWDWTFADFNEQFVLVKLKNGTLFGGFMGKESFVSSDPEERDIYIQEIYEIDKKNRWTSKRHGVFVTNGVISTIEFMPLSINGEGKNE